MPSTIEFEFGDVILVPFPFTDQQSTKKRPGVVISRLDHQRRHPDVVLMAITSRGQFPQRHGDVEIVEWEKAGLLRPSFIKPVIATIEQAMVFRRLGCLVNSDQDTLLAGLKEMIGR